MELRETTFPLLATQILTRFIHASRVDACMQAQLPWNATVRDRRVGMSYPRARQWSTKTTLEDLGTRAGILYVRTLVAAAPFFHVGGLWCIVFSLDFGGFSPFVGHFSTS